jgi:Protein of unknown function (DUF3054)
MARDDRSTPIAASLDALCVVIFVAIGRRNHDESSAIEGTLTTAAPFLISLAVAWIVLRAWRRPVDLRTGLLIWPIVVIVGMLVRRFVFDDGTALAFVIVATIFLGLTIVGWRAIWTVVESRRRQSAPV